MHARSHLQRDRCACFASLDSTAARHYIRQGNVLQATGRFWKGIVAFLEFVRFQIANHQTGDALEVTKVP